MASMTIRNLDDKLKARLRIQAAKNGRSMEEEARNILRVALSTNSSHGVSLVKSIRRRLEPLGGVGYLAGGSGYTLVNLEHVEDMAKLIADAVDADGNRVIDAIGPETYTFEELVRLIARSVGRSIRLIHVPTSLAYLATRLTGWFMGDVVLTRDEYRGLMGNLLAPGGPASGETRLSEWLRKNGRNLGMQYASEVARHYKAAEIQPTCPGVLFSAVSKRFVEFVNRSVTPV